MSANELRKKFLEFFKSKGHAIVPSSSLLPDDQSVLLTTAGMQQFKKYYTGEADPMRDFRSKSTASVQKCFRTSDIDEVGDERHNTFFEMLGNFSFGGYFKKEAISYGKDFFDSIGLEIEYVTVFAGDKNVPFDEESFNFWENLGIRDIRKCGREDNFWGPTGAEGPCGPTTEIYINGVEVWNIVFNEFYQQKDGTLEKLKTPGVDTGMGLERLAMVSQGKRNIFETDLFLPILDILPGTISERQRRIISDHLRASAFLLSDGVSPSNKEAGYILRRLLRRALVYEYINSLNPQIFESAIIEAIKIYGNFYPELKHRRDDIINAYWAEREKFSKTLSRGIKELEKNENITSEKAFSLYETFGLPYEIIKEFSGAKSSSLTRESFDKEFGKHQEKSRAGAAGKFGGHGLLLNTGELKAKDEEELKKVTRLHTATHLLQAALRKILGENVRQMGSDITVERTRFDFSFPRKLTIDEIKKVEDLINEAISRKLKVKMEEMDIEEAKRSGALYFFKEKYPAHVKVYSAGDFSKELCGGPHVKNTQDIGKFVIIKEEASASGVRRIRGKIIP
ncbi:hypothetical protein A3H65_03170 [Candidatus Giovannonibacteria bacterium RIFCSPLOWO2_02_FULL_45_14]|nr:MAG: hypothetical protein A3H65_03170 [Candidatus Giovannonibacteria bacterium RIFCSPLOWO2_02_FULL_45_14]